MPRYDFKCETDEQYAHDVILKVTHSRKDHPICPECGQAMEKMPSRVNAIFHGSGFHATDYRAPTRGY